jgi:homopolymeric O-antigen transport system permease protein
MRKKLKYLIEGFWNFFRTLVERRFLIYEMAKRDIALNVVGSLLGFFWTFINPMMMIFIFWLVFSFGFKMAPKNNVPYVIWFAAGMSIWNTFSEIINGSTGVILTNTHLVKKVVFPLSILPVTKLVASFVTHFIFLLVMFVLIFFYKLPPSLFWLQAIYYFLAMSVLALGVSWITASVNIFARDTAQIVDILLMFGFYVTPIFWDSDIMPPKVRLILELNPMYYIVQGYRESFLYSVPFWHHWQMTLYYWGVTLFVFALGAIIFLRLRPHFADVL